MGPALGAGAATGETPAKEAHPISWAVSIIAAFTVEIVIGYAETVSTLVPDAAVARARTGGLTQAVETPTLRSALIVVLAKVCLGVHRLADSGQTSRAGFAVTVAAAWYRPMVGLTDAIQARVMSAALGAGVAGGQTPPPEAHRTTSGAVLVVEAFIAEIQID
jgi:hypothetical protein